jgi:hypothetical protein
MQRDVPAPRALGESPIFRAGAGEYGNSSASAAYNVGTLAEPSRFESDGTFLRCGFPGEYRFINQEIMGSDEPQVCWDDVTGIEHHDVTGDHFR